MYGSEAARYRIDELVRGADSYRRSRSARVARSAERRSRSRRVSTAVATLLAWPFHR